MSKELLPYDLEQRLIDFAVHNILTAESFNRDKTKTSSFDIPCSKFDICF